MKFITIGLRILLASSFVVLPQWQTGASAAAKLQCGPTANTSNDLPRTIAIASNLAGTGAHALASGLSAVASRATPIAAKVQPYNGPNAWMPLMENGEVEFGIINILDSHMAVTGTGNYKKPYPMLRVVSGGVFPFTGSIMVRDKSEIKQPERSKGETNGMGFRRPCDHPDLAKRRHGSQRLKAQRCCPGSLFKSQRRYSSRSRGQSRRDFCCHRHRHQRGSKRDGADPIPQPSQYRRIQ